MFNELTSRQKTFVLEYCKNKNATQAAIAAGYNANSAAVQGSRLLTNEKIKAAIETLDNKKIADLRALFLDESRQCFNDVLGLIGELKEDVRENKDVRKQRLLFDALNSILDRAGYKAPDKLQADIKQENTLFEGMTKEQLIEFIKRPTLPEMLEDEKFTN